MYRSTDHHLAAAERAEDEAANAAGRREAFVARRESEITTMLATRPLQACVQALYGQERGATPIGADLAGWINEAAADPDRTVAECMWNEASRSRIVRKYAAARARLECEMLPSSYFDEAAA
jgi:hypothetical protein